MSFTAMKTIFSTRLSTNVIFSALLAVVLISCFSPTDTPSRTSLAFDQLTGIEGKPEYLHSPYATTGDRVYMVGFQDGTFPDLGWHIPGEMGGIWDHPIKLMDGFTTSITSGGAKTFCMTDAVKFVNFPMANVHYFEWPEENLKVERFQFVPDSVEGIIVQFKITNENKSASAIKFVFTARTDLRPTWLGERTNMNDAEDEIHLDKDGVAVLAKDKVNPWYVMFGADVPGTFSTDSARCNVMSNMGLGKNGTLSFDLTVPANGSLIIPFYIAGSHKLEDEVRKAFALLKSNKTELFRKKVDRYKALFQNSHISIPDHSISSMYEWLHFNVDWLVRSVPEQGVAISAGLPDYPWWFGADATYALQGALVMGDHALVKQSILLLHRISEKTNSNGRIVHEVSTNGAVFNPGNLNETAQFATLVSRYYAWTGDKELVAKTFPGLKKGMNWLLTEKDPDGNQFPNGSGMMEIPGLESQLEMIDVAAYTQQALESMVVLAEAVGDSIAAEDYRSRSAGNRLRINNEWWSEDEQSFGDFRSTLEEAIPIVDAALVRSDTLKKQDAVNRLTVLRKKMASGNRKKVVPHVVYSNWVVNTPLETGVADSAKAAGALQTARKYENVFGTFVTGIDKTDESDSVVLNSRKKVFSYTGAVMTLPTGVMAVAAARYGYSDQALDYLNKLHRSFSYALPGSMYEVSPDFGMMTQAWNIYGVAVPIVEYFFGIQPAAASKTIYIKPQLPTSWNTVSIDHVIVGDNVISLTIDQKEGGTEYRIHQSKKDWKIVLKVGKLKKVTVNDKAVLAGEMKDGSITLDGDDVTIFVSR